MTEDRRKEDIFLERHSRLAEELKTQKARSAELENLIRAAEASRSMRKSEEASTTADAPTSGPPHLPSPLTTGDGIVCPSCALQNHFGSVFCRSCGYILDPGRREVVSAQAREQKKAAMVIGVAQIITIAVVAYSMSHGDLASSEDVWWDDYWGSYQYSSEYACWSDFESELLWFVGSFLLIALSMVLYPAYIALLMSRFPTSSMRYHKKALVYSVISLALALVTMAVAFVKVTSEEYRSWEFTQEAYGMAVGAVFLVILSALLVGSRRSSVIHPTTPLQPGEGNSWRGSVQMIPQSRMLAIGFLLMAGGAAIANYGVLDWKPTSETTGLYFADHPGELPGVVLAILGVLIVVYYTNAFIRASGHQGKSQSTPVQPFSTGPAQPTSTGSPTVPSVRNELCTNCGSLLSPRSVFCGSCGHRRDGRESV